MNVKGVWDATLGILADAAVLVSQQENEVQTTREVFVLE